MSSYRGTADRPDQAKAVAGVILVHVALAAIILSGLNVRIVKQAVEKLTTIDIVQPPPPPPVRPPPRPVPKPAMKKPQGAAAKKAEPSPVVAPEPKLPVPSPIAAAKVAGSVAITIRVNPDGTVSNCRVVRTSGSPAADSLMCQLTLEYVRFSPARDRSGRPVAQDVTWSPNWAPR